MNIQIEHPTRQTGTGDKNYWTFVLTLVLPGSGFISSRGWRYWPSTGSVSPPQYYKERGRASNVVWAGGALYDDISITAQTYFQDVMGEPEPWEESKKFEPQEGSKASKKHETQEQRNERLLDALAEARKRNK